MHKLHYPIKNRHVFPCIPRLSSKVPYMSPCPMQLLQLVATTLPTMHRRGPAATHRTFPPSAGRCCQACPGARDVAIWRLNCHNGGVTAYHLSGLEKHLTISTISHNFIYFLMNSWNSDLQQCIAKQIVNACSHIYFYSETTLTLHPEQETAIKALKPSHDVSSSTPRTNQALLRCWAARWGSHAMPKHNLRRPTEQLDTRPDVPRSKHGIFLVYVIWSSIFNMALYMAHLNQSKSMNWRCPFPFLRKYILWILCFDQGTSFNQRCNVMTTEPLEAKDFWPSLALIHPWPWFQPRPNMKKSLTALFKSKHLLI